MVSAIALVDIDNKVLIAQRPKNKFMESFWEFPGGKIEENESEDKNSEDNNLSIDEKEEFSAEQTESSEIDDEFNQETEEELLDIPTFLRRQAN